MTIVLEMATTNLGSTRLSNVNVVNTTTITGQYSAIIGSSVSAIGVWSGTQAVGQPIVSVPATSTSGNFTLNKDGYDFNTGLYTVGYVVDSTSSTSSICATVILANGQYVQSQLTTLFVTNQRNVDGSSVLTINYSTPDGNTPLSNHDWVYLCAGGQVVNPAQSSITHQAVGSNANAGTMVMTVNPPLHYGNQYIIEYNPGATLPAVSAYYTFTFTGQ